MIEPCLRELIASRLFYHTLLSGISLHKAGGRGIAHEMFTADGPGMGQTVSVVAFGLVLLGGGRGGVPGFSRVGEVASPIGKSGG